MRKKHPDELADPGLGRSQGGFGTNIHLTTDCTGLPLSLRLSGGQAHESQYAEHILRQVGIIRNSGCLKTLPKAILVDKGYSCKALRNSLRVRGIKAVITFKSNEKASRNGRRKLNTHLYKKRNVVERCFAKLKEFRRFATRSAKTARNYLTMVKLGAIRLFKENARLRDMS